MGEASLNFSNVVKLHEDAAVDILPVVGENIDYGIEVGLPFLSPSIERDSRNVPVERVLARIREKRSVLWIVRVAGEPVAAIITSVMRYPMRDTLYIEHLGGSKISVWMQEALHTLVELARSADLSGIEADGRLGFEKYIGKCGFFKKTHVHFEMEI
tara:strand:+ start:4723 stop:5193 length:471 start_codon:yes stop_codon:yes gene_type:complete